MCLHGIARLKAHLSVKHAEQRTYINLLSDPLSGNCFQVFYTTDDLDCQIIKQTLINSETGIAVLEGEDTDLPVLILHHLITAMVTSLFLTPPPPPHPPPPPPHPAPPIFQFFALKRRKRLLLSSENKATHQFLFGFFFCVCANCFPQMHEDSCFCELVTVCI